MVDHTTCLSPSPRLISKWFNESLSPNLLLTSYPHPFEPLVQEAVTGLNDAVYILLSASVQIGANSLIYRIAFIKISNAFAAPFGTKLPNALTVGEIAAVVVIVQDLAKWRDLRAL